MSGQATFLRAQHQLDIAVPIKANGLIQIQSRQGKQFALPIEGYALQLAGLEPVIPRQIARTVLQNQPSKLWC